MVDLLLFRSNEFASLVRSVAWLMRVHGLQIEKGGPKAARFDLTDELSAQSQALRRAGFATLRWFAIVGAATGR